MRLLVLFRRHLNSLVLLVRRVIHWVDDPSPAMPKLQNHDVCKTNVVRNHHQPSVRK